ncbi:MULTISPECIES: MbtH family protein [Streptomyces]|uniref:Putative MbtH-like protein n=1 Tax=Streptomyces pyridomyceticus TaxID=68260 RepID=F6K7G9_9ACTN|nr:MULTISPECIES: MbtH family protein [Streptomyces]AEF33081.1 putative MbtH-like protein [Streptomyces pyridomyceticus]
MTNPFDDPDGTYRVLANDEGQHCLWPDALDVPQGWHTLRGAGTRQESLDFIAGNWTDLRPASLAAGEDGAR